MQVNPAEAAGIACSTFAPDVTNFVTPSVGCQVGSTNNDFVGGPNSAGYQVNVDSMFGINTWLFAGKDNEGLNISPEFPGTSKTSGTWDISSFIQPNWTNIMLVLKGGAGNNTQPNYVGYLLDGTSGDWMTPFFTATGREAGNPKDVSHISLYYTTGDTTSVPTPALLPGLIGMGFAAWRKRKTNQSEANA